MGVFLSPMLIAPAIKIHGKTILENEYKDLLAYRNDIISLFFEQQLSRVSRGTYSKLHR